MSIRDLVFKTIYCSDNFNVLKNNLLSTTGCFFNAAENLVIKNKFYLTEICFI